MKVINKSEFTKNGIKMFRNSEFYSSVNKKMKNF